MYKALHQGPVRAGSYTLISCTSCPQRSFKYSRTHTPKHKYFFFFLSYEGRVKLGCREMGGSYYAQCEYRLPWVISPVSTLDLELFWIFFPYLQGCLGCESASRPCWKAAFEYAPCSAGVSNPIVPLSVAGGCSAKLPCLPNIWSSLALISATFSSLTSCYSLPWTLIFKPTQFYASLC